MARKKNVKIACTKAETSNMLHWLKYERVRDKKLRTAKVEVISDTYLGVTGDKYQINKIMNNLSTALEA